MNQYEGVFADDEIAEQRAALRLRTVVFAVDGLIQRGATGEARALVTGGAFDSDLGPGAARFLLDRIGKSEKDNALLAAKQSVEARTLAVAEIGHRVAKGQVFPEERAPALTTEMPEDLLASDPTS